MELQLLEAEPDPNPDEPKPPSYSKPGWILVDVYKTSGNDTYGSTVYKGEYEVTDWDRNSSVTWIYQGMGFDYWLDMYCEFPTSGTYVIEGIRGTYIRAAWPFEDDDEDWSLESITLVTWAEIMKRLFG